MHFVLLIEKVKYNLLSGAAPDEKCIQICVVEKSDGSYLDKPSCQCGDSHSHVTTLNSGLYNSDVYGLYWVKPVDNISVLQEGGHAEGFSYQRNRRKKEKKSNGIQIQNGVEYCAVQESM